MSNNCDNRYFTSSQIYDLRNINFRGNREYVGMNDPQLEIKKWLEEKLRPRGTATKLSIATGWTPVVINRMKNYSSEEPKQRRQIKADELNTLIQFFGENPPGFGSNQVSPELISDNRRSRPNASFPPQWTPFPADYSIPLRGHISAGANGRFIMNGQDIARVFCPPGLEGVAGAYAVQIQGSSGEPRFYDGETAWINPNAPVRQGDDVIVQVMDGDEVSSFIKRFVSKSSAVVRLYQYNPGEGEVHELQFDANKVFSIHKVVFHAML
jgi:phage repressor protein C with HTH and peptisase S24 domain